jgi:hypothetical protein
LFVRSSIFKSIFNSPPSKISPSTPSSPVTNSQ